MARPPARPRRPRRPRRPPPLHPFERALGLLVRREGLFRDGDRVVVALSGGPDSTALLLGLAALAAGPGPKARLLAAHLDHGLRPGSRGDAASARSLARSLGVPFRSSRLRGLRDRAGGSLEAAARRERYAFLARVARASGARAVAVAHHRDDRAETVLHRVLQGGALAGLAGIPLRRPLPGAPGCEVVRPLYEADREGVMAYLRDRGAVPREDPTNRDGSNARARLRGRVLPAVLGAYPHARTALLRLEGLAREAAGVLDARAGSGAAGIRASGGAAAVPRSAFEGCGAEGIRRLLREALRRIGARPPEPPRAAVDRLAAALRTADGRTRRVPVRRGIEAAVDAGEVRVRAGG